MANKYHVNKETGRANICRATGKRGCPLGADTPHFDTKEQAKKYIEKEAAAEHDLFTKVEKNLAAKVNDTTMVPDAKNEKPSWQLMEESLARKKALIDRIKTDYANSNTVINHEYKGLAWGSAELEEHNKDYQKLKGASSDEELKSIHRYTGIGYANINQYLEDSESLIKQLNQNIGGYDRYIDEIKKNIKNIDNYIARSPKRDKTVYRTLDQGRKVDANMDHISSEEWLRELNIREGGEVSFRGFLSTTSDPVLISRRLSGDDEHLGVAFVISTREGAPIDQTATRPEENTYAQATERKVLLPRNMNFSVDKIERARFTDRDGDSIEPITVYLSEIR